jgi:tetratricopeptide (TPR) repeat protein
MRQLLPDTPHLLYRRLLALSMAAVLLMVCDIHAQVLGSNQHANDVRHYPEVSEIFWVKIQEAAHFLQPPEGAGLRPEPKKAIQLLAALELERASLNAYELVLLYQYSGYAYLAQENYDKAIEYYSKVLLQSPYMPVTTEAQMWLTLGQLYSVKNNPKKALDTMLKWSEYVDELRPEQSYTFATLYYQLGDNRNSLLNLNRAINRQQAAGKIPSEYWYLLQRELYFEREDYQNGLVALNNLIKHYPKAQYWKHLSYVYKLLKRDTASLSALETCYQLGGLTTERDLLGLAYLMLKANIPYKAAKVLRKGIYTDKLIEPNAKNLKLLADALRAAQYPKESLAEYEKAVQKSHSADLIIGLASAYLANERYKEAAKWARNALKTGPVKRPDQAFLIIGQAELQLKNFDEAIHVFKEASKDARSKKTALEWISYAESEKAKLPIAKNHALIQ